MAAYHTRVFTRSQGFGGVYSPEYAMVQGETTLDDWLSVEDENQYILENMDMAGERGELVRVVTKKRTGWGSAA